MSAIVAPEAGAVEGASLRLERLLGSGRHGHAFVARRCGNEDASTVVVKVGIGARREKAALARFSHPAIITVIDATDSMLVLEHAEAGTTAGLLRNRGGLPAPELAGIARSIGSALEMMHEAGWVHGDVTADNIGVRSDGTVALLDFATARPADGSPLAEYSPTYVGSDPVARPEIDIRALATTLSELLGPDGDPELSAGLDSLVTAVDSGTRSEIESVKSLFEDIESERVLVGSGPPPVDRGGTADFGPRPEPGVEEPVAQPVRRWPLALAAIVLPIATVTVGWALTGTASTDVPPPSNIRRASLTLAENNARWDEASGELWLDGATYRIGRPGDEAALADWNCDGRLSLGVYRSATQEWFEFDSWTAGSTAHPRPLTLDGRLAVLVDPTGCARPVGA